MGFSEYEKTEFMLSLREDAETYKILDHFYPEDVISYLKQNNFYRLVRDYSIIPKGERLHKAESIVMVYMLDPSITIKGLLLKWAGFLSPPVITFEKNQFFINL